MSTIKYKGKSYRCQEGETVLECLNRKHVDVPSSCQSGVCRTCMMRAISGSPPPAAQQGLERELVEKGYFLACACRPTEDLEAVLSGDDVRSYIQARVIAKEPLSEEIVRVRIVPAARFDYHPGQYLNIRRADGAVRSYSLGSLPIEDSLDLHIREIPGGEMSSWLANEVRVGSTLDIEGPHGDCIYSASMQSERPLLLVGSGTGLCPLWGILREALARGHCGPIRLFHGSYTRAGLYLVDELKALAAERDNFSYHPCVDEAGEGDDLMVGRVDQVVIDAIPDLQGWEVYLCGHPGMVEATWNAVLSAGADESGVHADPFTPTPAA